MGTRSSVWANGNGAVRMYLPHGTTVRSVGVTPLGYMGGPAGPPSPCGDRFSWTAGAGEGDDAVTTLEVTFPDEWLTMPMTAAGGGVTTLLPTFDQLDFDRHAFLALLGEWSGVRVQAFCAVGAVPGSGTDDELRSVAETGRHPGLERDTVDVELSVGRGVRSSAFRFASELLDDTSIAPYTAEVRFALPLPGNRIGVLHFETLSLTCFEELECLFDTIAGTARIA